MRLIAFFTTVILLTTTQAFAADHVWYDKPQEPKLQLVVKAMDYYQNTYAFNTKEPCKGTNCIPAGSVVGCSGYSLVDDVGGTQVQFCHISTIQDSKDAKPVDVSAEDRVMATGFVAENKKYVAALPGGQIFSASREKKKTEAAACDVNCAGGVANKLSDFAKAMVNVAAPKNTGVASAALKEKVGDAVTIQVEKQKIANACTNFLDKDGELGPWGNKAIKAFNKVDWECFKSGMDTSGVCPKYKTFNERKKEYFWVWTLASMAHVESSCKVNAINPKAANETGYGLMQMENAKYRKTRDKRYCPHYKINEQDVTFQMECTASIFSDMYCKRGLSLTSSQGYWAGLLSPKRKIAQQIKKFPGCY